MGKRARRQPDRAIPRRVPSLLTAIAEGEFDDHLVTLAEAIDARRLLLHTLRSGTALATLRVGDLVRINRAVSPRYLAGLQATVVEIDDHAATLQLREPVGRFSTGRVRCPPLAIDRLASPPVVQTAAGSAQGSSSSEA